MCAIGAGLGRHTRAGRRWTRGAEGGGDGDGRGVAVRGGEGAFRYITPPGVHINQQPHVSPLSLRHTTHNGHVTAPMRNCKSLTFWTSRSLFTSLPSARPIAIPFFLIGPALPLIRPPILPSASTFPPQHLCICERENAQQIPLSVVSSRAKTVLIPGRRQPWNHRRKCNCLPRAQNGKADGIAHRHLEICLRIVPSHTTVLPRISRFPPTAQARRNIPRAASARQVPPNAPMVALTAACSALIRRQKHQTVLRRQPLHVL